MFEVSQSKATYTKDIDPTSKNDYVRIPEIYRTLANRSSTSALSSFKIAYALQQEEDPKTLL